MEDVCNWMKVILIIANRSSISPLATNQRSFGSFDLGSTDEIGIADYGSRSFRKLDVTIPSTMFPSSVKSSADNSLTDRNNIMNGSLIYTY